MASHCVSDESGTGSCSSNFLKRKLIFCISAGRCGTNYLSGILGSCENVVAYHEPYPQMSDKWNQLVINSSIDSTFDQRTLKATEIKKLLSQLAPEQVYVETNHMFIKTFYDVIMESFNPEHCDLYIIILRRYLPAMLKSRVQLGHFAQKPEHGWIYTLHSKNAIIPPLPLEQSDFVDLLIGYLMDMEAQTEKFCKQYSSRCNIIEVRTEELNTISGVQNLCNFLGLKMTNATLQKIGLATNTRDSEKLEFSNEHSNKPLEWFKCRIGEYIKKCQESGIQLPELPHMEEWNGPTY